MRKYTHVPHPFVIHTTEVSADGEFTIDLALFGKTNRHFPYFVMTFLRMGRSGLSSKRAVFDIESIKTGDREVFDFEENRILDFEKIRHFEPSDDDPRQLVIRMLSPCTLQKNGKMLGTFDLRTFIASLLRRIKNLAYFHANLDLEIDFSALIDTAEKHVSVVEDRTRVVSRNRFSARQKQSMNIGGFVGTVTLQGDIKPLLPYLELGAIVHNGKKTSFGNGKYVLAHGDG